jgi:KUP system potassium uptake protein
MNKVKSPGAFAALTIGSLGVVFGDIGTSPIYAFRQSLNSSGSTAYDIFGVVSLIFWSLMLVVSVKYLTFVLRADNNGEGGILALFALLPWKIKNAQTGARYGFLVLLMLGTALLFGDGILTPAISVLSATEGLGAIDPRFVHLTVPITVVILVILFGLQYKGSGSIGRLFGPVILVWFGTIGYLGFRKVAEMPHVVKALSPYYAVEYIGHHGLHTFVILSSVILAITGAEALYADLGHFGKTPIRVSWYLVVAPTLILNYLGQAVVALQNPNTKGNLFFDLAPTKAWTLYLVLIATAATVIASQALITGVASLSRQAVKLGLFPRLKIVHTSADLEGQIYVPAINLLVGIGSIFLVINFRSSNALANAYSFAISGTMLVTTLAFGFVAKEKLKWSKGAIAIVFPLLLVIDIAFFLSTVTKLIKGAWVPLVIALAITYLMWTWRKGQRALSAALSQATLGWDEVEELIESNSISVIPDTGVYLSSTAIQVPQALVSQVRNLRSIPSKIIVVEVITGDIPVVSAPPRVREINPRVTEVIIWVGFNQQLSVSKILAEKVLTPEIEAACTYYLSDRKFVESSEGVLSGLTERVFALLHRNSATASDYFGLPDDRVISLGTRMDI